MRWTLKLASINDDTLSFSSLPSSFPILVPFRPRLANHSFLIGPDGAVAVYIDEIHMFDVELSNGQGYYESKAYRPCKSRGFVNARGMVPSLGHDRPYRLAKPTADLRQAGE